jgi:Tfp pilus assembly protein PilF
MIRQDANDAFLSYALALEYVSADRLEEAIELLEKLMRMAPDYSAAFHQAGRVYERLDKPEHARRCYEEGVRVAEKAGDLHARNEMSQALTLLED